MLEGRTGEIIGDPVEAHKELTAEFTKWLEGPNGGRGGCMRVTTSRGTRKVTQRSCRTQAIRECLMS